MSRESRRLRRETEKARRELRRLHRQELSRRLRKVDERMLDHAEEDATIRPDPVDPLRDPLP